MHTKEPWIQNHDDILASGDPADIIAECAWTDGMNAHCNARRIVACVNACAGISTDNLEDNKPIIEGLRILNNHRKELLDALKYAAGALGTDGHDPIVDAAIAKAEAA